MRRFHTFGCREILSSGSRFFTRLGIVSPGWRRGRRSFPTLSRAERVAVGDALRRQAAMKGATLRSAAPANETRVSRYNRYATGGGGGWRQRAWENFSLSRFKSRHLGRGGRGERATLRRLPRVLTRAAGHAGALLTSAAKSIQPRPPPSRATERAQADWHGLQSTINMRRLGDASWIMVVSDQPGRQSEGRADA